MPAGAAAAGEHPGPGLPGGAGRLPVRRVGQRPVGVLRRHRGPSAQFAQQTGRGGVPGDLEALHLSGGGRTRTGRQRTRRAVGERGRETLPQHGAQGVGVARAQVGLVQPFREGVGEEPGAGQVVPYEVADRPVEVRRDPAPVLVGGLHAPLVREPQPVGEHRPLVSGGVHGRPFVAEVGVGLEVPAPRPRHPFHLGPGEVVRPVGAHLSGDQVGGRLHSVPGQDRVGVRPQSVRAVVEGEVDGARSRVRPVRRKPVNSRVVSVR